MTDRTDEHSRDVSVIIPVYNTGKFLHYCVDSLLRQSLPQDRFEAIFVDDGSTDGTERALDDLAAEHDNFVVVHQENSGWPGKPRNVGIDRARGRYVFFMDHDDALGDEALERMVAMADADNADILIGKMVGQGRGVPRDLFRKNLHGASLGSAPLMDSLTPHKLFRSSFVRQHDLRFPEGRRRLEDHVFVVRAYFLATSISVLADYPCYYHTRREDTGNAGYQALDPAGYYGNLREVVDIIEEHTEPGAFRDRLLRRPYRVEMLRRLQGGELLGRDENARRELFDEIRRLALERFPESVASGFPAMLRVGSELLRAGDLDGLVAQAEFYRQVHASATLSSLSWDGTTIFVGFEAGLEDDHGLLRFESVDGHVLLPVAPGVGSRVSAESRRVDDDLDRATVSLVLRDRETKAEFFVPLKVSRRIEKSPDGESVSVRVDATGSIDPRTARSGERLVEGRWDVVARVALSGWTMETRLGSQRADGLNAACVALPVGSPPRLVLPYWTEPHGNLTIRAADPLSVLARTKAALTQTGGRFVLDMPLRQALESPPPAQLVLERGRHSAIVTLTAEMRSRRHIRWVSEPRRSLRPLVRSGTSVRLVLGTERSAQMSVDLPAGVIPSRGGRSGLGARLTAAVRRLRHRAGALSGGNRK